MQNTVQNTPPWPKHMWAWVLGGAALFTVLNHLWGHPWWMVWVVVAAFTIKFVVLDR